MDIFTPIATPFGWLLMGIYHFVQNYALSLFLLAVIVKVLLLPFQMKGKRGQLRQARLQPKMAEIQKKHAANKQKLNEEMAKLYKEEGVNPASGCLWSFIQMPIMIAMFYAIRQPLSLMMRVPREYFTVSEDGVKGQILQILEKIPGIDLTGSDFTGFYAEIYIAQAISDNWNLFVNAGIEKLQYITFYLFPKWGFLNLSEVPNWQFWTWGNEDINILPTLILFTFPLFSGGAQFVSAHIMRKMNAAGPAEATAGAMGKVLKFMPLMSVWFGFMFPAALSFYWTIGTVLQIGQDIWLTKKYTKILDAEDADKAVARKEKEEDIEAKRLETERKKAEGIVERNTNTSKRKKKKTDKTEQLEKAAEWEKKNTPPEAVKDTKNEPGRIGNRRYARGRAYDPDRYPEVAEGEVIDATGEGEVVGSTVVSDADSEYKDGAVDVEFEEIDDTVEDNDDEGNDDGEDNNIKDSDDDVDDSDNNDDDDSNDEDSDD